MPLSKVRDRERKARERAKFRLDRLFLSMTERKPVQPKPIIDGISHWGNYGGRDYEPKLDADGNPIYED